MPEASDIPSLLAGVPIFRSFSSEQLAEVAERTSMVEFAAEESILELGDAGQALYVLVEGEVQVVYPSRAEPVELARLGPGDFFGEMSLLNERPRSATVRTTRPTRALKLEKRAFQELLQSSPPMALTLLEVLSVRIRNADEQISDLSDQALRDPLTGLLNRRSFYDRLAEECDRTRRYGEPFSLVLLDLDKFKSVNDNFGHAVGDQVLAWVGRLINEHTRSADSAYRIGGEEFAIICPSSEGEVAANAARRLVDVVAQARPPLDFDLQTTISAGYACAPTDARRPDTLFHVADRALLRAKAEGRNRVAPPASTF